MPDDPKGLNKALCEVDACHLNPHHYLSKVACSPAGRGDYAEINSTRDLAGQMKVCSVIRINDLNNLQLSTFLSTYNGIRCEDVL